MKRGVSAVVATVIFVLITTGAVGIIWSTVSPVVKESFSEGFEEADLSIVTSEGYTAYDADLKIACVQIERGADEANLSKIGIVFQIEGDSVTFEVPPIERKNESLEINEKRTYCFNLSNYSVPTKASVFPFYSDGEVGQILSETDLSSEGSYAGDTRLYNEIYLEEDSEEDLCGNGNCDSGESLRNCPADCLDKTASAYLWAYPQFLNRPIETYYGIDDVRFFWDVDIRPDHTTTRDYALDPEVNAIFSKYLRPQSVDFCTDGNLEKYSGSYDYDRFMAGMQASGDNWLIMDGDEPYNYCDYSHCDVSSICETAKYLINVSVPSFQQWAIEEIFQYQLNESYKDSIFYCDNCDETDDSDLWTYTPALKYGVNFSGISFDNLGMMTGNPMNDNSEIEYFTDYLCNVKNALNDEGYVLSGNLGSSSWRVENFKQNGKTEEFQEMISCLDLVMDEYPITDYNAAPKVPIYYPGHWENTLDNYELALDAGTGLLFYSSSLRTTFDFCEDADALAVEENTFKYLYSSYMLIWRPEKCFFEFYDGCKWYNGELVRGANHYEHSYLEYDLGDAEGTRYLKDGVWVREFENGISIVNPYLQDYTLSLREDYENFDGANVGDSILVKSRTGMILKKA